MENRKIIGGVLACPVCGSGLSLTENGKSAECAGKRRHLFDFASGGYINLYPSRASGGDSGECIAARNAFLAGGYYEKISDEINLLLDKYACAGARVLDAGCGEGYYTLRMAQTGRTAFGFDLSKNGVNIAAKAAKRTGAKAFFGVASVFALPVKSESIGALTNIFAPCAEAEYSRVLRSGGVLIVVGAAKDHLFGLKSKIYDTPSKNTDRADLPTSLSLIDTVRLTYEIELKTNDEIKTLFSMTPYFYRTDAEGFARLNSLDRVKTEVDVLLHVYKKG